MQELKANTSVDVRIGPFVDKTDGLTPETGITLGSADEAELLKHNGAAVTDISGATWAAVSSCDGWYDLTLTTGHTDTEGQLTVVVQDDSECLPVFAHFMVLSEAAWDSKYAAKDTGYMDVNVKAISEDTTAADNLELFTEVLENGTGLIDAGTFKASAIDASALAADAVAEIADGVWDEVLTAATHNVAASAGRRLRDTSETTFLESGTADAGASSTITLENGVASSDNDWYNHTICIITGGTGAGQARGIDGYVGSTRVATVHPDWVTAPNATSTYSIMAFSEVHVHHIETDAITADALNADAATEIADAVGTAMQADPTLFEVNVVEIDGQATSGNNATLNLKQLNVVNSAGSAIVATSSGSNGYGMVLQGNGSGDGLRTTGGATGSGIRGIGGSSSGNGIQGGAVAGNGRGMYLTGIGTGPGLDTVAGITGPGLRAVGGATSGDGISASATDGDGIHAVGGGNNHGLNLDGAGLGSGLSATGGPDGNGFYGLGGGTTGAGMLVQAQNNNDPGLECIAHGTGDDLAADNLLQVGGGGDATEAKQDTIIAAIGTPTALDAGAATIGGMLTKMADDNAGADFDATTDSLQAIRDRGDTAWTTGVGGVAGVGSYTHTITIRTTGGAPLAGVGVWVNTANDRTAAVAGTLYTNSSGTVTFNLDYTTHYIFCTLAGYSFDAASFTSSAGNVDFTKDIATATSAGSSSVYDNSFLTRALATVREMIDEPTINKKYTDARIITQLEKSYVHILGEVNRNTRTPAVGTFSVSVNTGSTAIQSFTLPHNAGMIMAVYVEGEFGERYNYGSRSRHNLLGRSVWIEGQTLKVQPQTVWGIDNGGTATLKVEHVPVGVASLHNGTLTLDADGDVATFAASPNVGAMDTHVQAYLGCTLRILEVDGTTVTGNVMQERTISSYDNSTRAATLDTALSPIPTTDDGSIYYEIAPTIHKGLDEIVATYTAYVIALNEGNHKRANGILKRYQTEIRTVRLTSYYSRVDEAPKQRADNYDNRRYPYSNRRRI
jgi:hypothetical protein